MREKATQVQEAQSVPIKRNTNRYTPRHIIIKRGKFRDKERMNLKGRKGGTGHNIKGSLKV